MIGFLLDSLGRLFAVLPLGFAETFCKALGDLIFFCLKKKRRALLSNLHHAFPNKPEGWHERIGRISCRRTVELGLYVLASPCFSRKRLRQQFVLDPGLVSELEHALAINESGVILVPHLCLME
ncbi:MAG: hypothetical protein AAGA45_04000, partial [Verrucomicrobiota bacterium]